MKPPMVVDDPALELETRRNIYEEIRKSPGLHFRELQRRTDTATGMLQYHLGYLEKHRLVKTEKVENTKRFFALRTPRLEGEEQIMPFLRQEKTRHLLISIIQSKRNTIQNLAKKTGTPYSTTSRLLDKLVEAGILEKKRSKKRIQYYTDKREQIIQMLLTYKKSFLDEMVDEFVHAWQDLNPTEKTTAK